MIEPIAHAILYAIKGGQHGFIARPIVAWAQSKHRYLHWVIDKLVDGTYLSSVLFGVIHTSPLAALGWFIGVCVSLGEEIGAIGGFRGNWRPEGRSWGWKRGLQRGVFLGAMLALALPTFSTGLIIAGATFPACVWLGVSLEQLRTGKIQVSWRWYEPIFGAVIGAAFLWRF